MKRYVLLSAFAVLFSLASKSQNIKANQVSYYTGATKYAVAPGAESGSFTVKDASTNAVVFTGTLGSAQNWGPSGESIRIADFTSFNTPGSYYVQTSNEKSYTFKIQDYLGLNSLSRWSLKAFYMWRASTAISATCATFNGQSYARSAGHADDQVLIHSSAATTARPAGTKVSAPKGWYDAGDYNLYVVNAGMSVHSLLLAYETMPLYFDTLNLNIPESSNSVPDILDEVKWELDWLLAMQDPGDGGVYFKLTSLYFCGFVMPNADNLTRYMVGKSTTSALDFAAMTAMAYRVYKNYETTFPGFAAKCLTASRSAYAWAQSHPGVAFTNPSDVSTGEYGDNTFTDEFFWAAAELYISTGEQTFYDALNFNLGFYSPSWADVAGMGLMSLKAHVDELPSSANKTTINSKFLTLANNVYSIYNTSTYKVPIADFYWGSNGSVASNGSVLALAFNTLKDKKYLDAMVAGTDYILGRNATGYSFVTWFGTKNPVNIHHRPSGADGIVKPLPGYVAGGPCTDATTDCGTTNYPTTSYKARCYTDMQCSYSTNEVAINWNAPLANMIASMEYAFIPASVDSAIVPVTNAKTIELYLSKALNVTSISDLSAFTVTMNGAALALASVAIDNTNAQKIVITTSTSMTAGTTILVSYKGRMLTTTLNNTPVQAFTDLKVKNNLVTNILTQKLSLKAGWNLISLYLTPTNKLTDSVFSSIISNIITVKNQDYFFDPSQPAQYNSLTSIQGGEAYFVKVGTDVQLTLTGTAISSKSYDMKQGWNLIGYPKLAQMPITEAYNAIWSDFYALKNFDGFYIKNSGLNNLSSVDPGIGYFMYLNAATTFIYP